MRILQLSDLHGATRVLDESPALIDAHDPDLVLVTGDITNFGPLDYARDLFAVLPDRSYGIPGNCDPLEIVPLMEQLGVNLHGRKVEVEGETLIGFGGSSPTPFHTPFELSEDTIHRELRPLMEPRAILATHAPARGHVDTVRGGSHAGSRAVESLVADFAPKALLSGHIHEARGVESGETTFVNPGPAYDGNAAVVDVGEGVVVTLLP